MCENVNTECVQVYEYVLRTYVHRALGWLLSPQAALQCQESFPANLPRGAMKMEKEKIFQEEGTTFQR